MAYSDSVALFQARCLANLPQAAVGGNSVIYNLAQAFLAADADTNYALTQSTPNLFLAQATGSALDAKAADYGVSRNIGVAAIASVVFSVQSAAPATLTIPAGTLISTVGDGIVTVPVIYVTTAVATISSGFTASNAVSAVAQTNGVVGNVAIGAVSVVVTSFSFGAATVTNAAPATGGVDPDSDATLRNKAFAAISAKYSTTAIQAAIMAVPGVFDAYVFDPQDGGGKIAYMWCDVSGATPGLSGTTPGSTTVSGTITAATLAASVDAAVLAVLPPNITPVRSSFIVDNVTAVSVVWSGPSTLSTSTIDPLIKAAVVGYLQGLVHNQIPTVFGMSQYVQFQLGFSLSNFTITSSTPTFSGSAANNTIWRCTGGVGVVTVTP